MPRKNKIKIMNIVGARPNFMKIAPLYRRYKEYLNYIDPILVHTNQHYDQKMSATFFDSLGIPMPNYTLSTNQSTPLSLIADVIRQLETIVKKEKLDLILVVGDVNSTLAASIVGNKLNIKVAHVEAGLRSNDRTMPEEINRILVDHIADLLFVTEQSGIENLQKEGVEETRMFFVGNVMIDNLIESLNNINQSSIREIINLEKMSYFVVTIHRPSNVDSKENLQKMVTLLREIAETFKMPLVFPIHPRTSQKLKEFGLEGELHKIEGLKLVEPMDYIDFIKLVKDSAVVLTDSGGIQEEAAYLKIPTITLRDSTERPSTIACGSNKLCSLDNVDCIKQTIARILKSAQEKIDDIPFNDGQTSNRIIETIINHFNYEKR